MFGIKIPRTVEEALRFDKENGNTLWADAIAKEITSLLKYNVFEFHNEKHHFPKSEGWQYAPLRMIFNVKHDLRRKARLVIGGHVTDAEMYDCYAATIKTENIRLLFYLMVSQGLSVISGDVGTAYLNSITEEKIYTRAGPEFGDKQGCILRVVKGLYGLKTSAHAWYQRLSASLRQMGFRLSRLDGAFWYRLRDDKSGYDYLAHHVDDFIIAAKDPNIYLQKLKLSLIFLEMVSLICT